MRARAHPPDDAATAAAMELMQVLHSISKADARTPARDLTLGQIRLLILLRRHGPQPMGRIAEAFQLSSTAASGFVARTQRHGFVERRHRTDDRRVVEVELTDSGAQFVDELAGMRLEGIRSVLEVLTPSELADFRALLARIAERQAATT